ncbi:MAG: hypothetical protein DMG78_22860 [Acidobacteria bacterium]|nr:MAG: hypothetical protein DMG78_22860 [Acidobacteriota bacterium]
MQISFMEWAARSSLSVRIDGCLGIGRPGAVGGIGIGASRDQARPRGGDVAGFDALDDQGDGGPAEAKACRNYSGELAG